MFSVFSYQTNIITKTHTHTNEKQKLMQKILFRKQNNKNKTQKKNFNVVQKDKN